MKKSDKKTFISSTGDKYTGEFTENKYGEFTGKGIIGFLDLNKNFKKR